MHRGCLGHPGRLGHTGQHIAAQVPASSIHRTVATPSPPAYVGPALGASLNELSYPSHRHKLRPLKPGHDRTAVTTCAATQRVPALPSSISQGPAQFNLLTECGSPPSSVDVQEVLPHLTPKQLADAVWCFAQHEVKPTAQLMDAVAQEIHSKLPQFRAQDLSNTLWAFAMLKYQPTEQWWQDFERQVYGSLTDLTDRQLANLIWAFAVLERRPEPAAPGGAEAEACGAGEPAAASADPEASTSAPTSSPCSSSASCSGPQSPRRGWVLAPLLSQSCAGGFSGYSAGSLHLLVWSLGRLHVPPSPAWLAGFLPAAEAHFFKFSPTELANIIWALAKLGVSLPGAWLDKLLLVAQWRFPSFPARLLSIVAWSTATLQHRPQPEWLMCFEEQVRAKFLDFSGHELACVAWALRRFGYSTRNNAVFYMLQKQQRFLDADFEILSNPRLLRQVLGWRTAQGGEDAEDEPESSGGGRSGSDNSYSM